MFNASAEIAAAANYPDIRVFTTSLEYSTTAQIDLLGIEEIWSVAGPSKFNEIRSHECVFVCVCVC